MPASSTQYGTTLPSGSDPYPIESVLAKIVGENNPAEAANLLDVYQTQRAADTGNYNYALGQQHDFAQQQLAQQLKEQYLKSAMDAVQHRGGLSVFNQMVGPGNAIDPGLTGSIEGGLTNLQNATVAKDVGTAAYQGLEGGLATDAGLAGSMTGGLFSGSTVPLALQKEAMVQAGHNARAGAGKSPFTFTSGPQEEAGGGTVSGLKAKPGENLAQATARWRNELGINIPSPVPLPTPRGGTPTPDQGSAGPPPPAAKPSKTSLAPAPSGGTRVQASASGGSRAQQFANQYVENNLRINNKPAYDDVMANAKGGNVTVVQGADGKLHLQGKQGQY